MPESQAKHKWDYSTTMMKHLDRILERSFESGPDEMNKGILYFEKAIPKSWLKLDAEDGKTFLELLEELRNHRASGSARFEETDSDRVNVIAGILEKKGLLIEELETDSLVG